MFEDPFGVIWSVSDSTRQIEDIPTELENKIMPCAMVCDASGYLQFLQNVFGATPSMEPMKQSNGKVRAHETSKTTAERSYAYNTLVDRGRPCTGGQRQGAANST